MTRSQNVGWITSQLSLMFGVIGSCMMAIFLGIPFSMLTFLGVVVVNIVIAVLIGLAVAELVTKTLDDEEDNHG